MHAFMHIYLLINFLNFSGSYWTMFYTVYLDELVYFVPKPQGSLWMARAYCARFPGHRLAIFKSQEQFGVVSRIYEKEGKVIL